MKAFLVFGFFGLIFLCSCVGNLMKTESAVDLIPRDSFVSVLKDIYILEGFLQNQFIQMNDHHATIQKSGDVLLEKYAISHDRFKRSLDFYASNQETMQEINNQILDSLNMELSKVQ